MQAFDPLPTALAVFDEPRDDRGRGLARLICPLSLSYDHRVVDGAAAARFTAHLAGELADLRRVLL